MTHYPVSTDTLKEVLATRIEEAEAELRALKAVAINNKHKALNNRSVWSEIDGVNVRVGDYLSIGKALYVSYQVNQRYYTTDITAYSYVDEDGKELGVEGYRRISRTITPIELQKVLDSVILNRKDGIKVLKHDLANANTIIKKYNALSDKLENLRDSLSWASRGVLK